MSTAIIENPDKIECTLTFTMTLKEWKQIRKTLDSNPSYAELKVTDEIIDLVRKVEQVFFSDVKEDG